jgi:uncharacterized protein RhaS with RHS repeats
MHARYYSPNLGRFVSVDPVGGTVGSSQSWNRYSYVLNNPVGMVDPSGQSGITFWIKQVAKGWRKGTRSQAVRAAGENVHNVRVVGDGASKKARGIVKELNKNKGKKPGTKRHDHDGKHWQTKRSSKWGRVHYGKGLLGGISFASDIGNAAGDAVENATSSKAAGDAVALGIELVNPASDVQFVLDLAGIEPEQWDDSGEGDSSDEQDDVTFRMVSSHERSDDPPPTPKDD